RVRVSPERREEALPRESRLFVELGVFALAPHVSLVRKANSSPRARDLRPVAWVRSFLAPSSEPLLLSHCFYDRSITGKYPHKAFRRCHGIVGTEEMRMAKKNRKFIFVIGGVMSGVGKGIATASIGKILSSRGLKVNLMKIDPYLNVDAGTMNPT